MPVPDFTDRYNTSLEPGDEYGYQNWLQLQSALNQRDMAKDNFDYDLRGAYKAGAAQSDNGHFPDTFKKPNHPSFSDQSQYHGLDGHAGGSWQLNQGQWSFTPGAANLGFHGPEGLNAYFQKTDPGVRVLGLPPARPTSALDYVQRNAELMMPMPVLPGTGARVPPDTLTDHPVFERDEPDVGQETTNPQFSREQYPVHVAWDRMHRAEKLLDRYPDDVGINQEYARAAEEYNAAWADPASNPDAGMRARWGAAGALAPKDADIMMRALEARQSKGRR